MLNIMTHKLAFFCALIWICFQFECNLLLVLILITLENYFLLKNWFTILAIIVINIYL